MVNFLGLLGLQGLPGIIGGWPWQHHDEKLFNRLYRTTLLSARPICQISAVAGMSIGVLHRGEVIYRDNAGFRSAHSPLPPDSKTVYGIGSLTKAFTAVVLSNLLDDHANITLDTPVDRILTDYAPVDEQLRHQVSLGDFLSHRSGLFGDMSFAMQGQFECLLPKNQLLPTISSLKTVAPIRRQWLYNNWGYAMAGAVIEKLTGKSFGTYMSESVLEPLGLQHTTSQPDFRPYDNVARPHMSLCNATPLPVNQTYFFKDTFFEPAGGLYSNVDDMLKWAKAVLHAEANPSSSSESVLRHIPSIISNQIPLDEPSHEFRFYGMGWARTQLPGVVGLLGDNIDFFPVSELPILGAGAPPMVTYYHQGSAPGYYSSLFLFPESETAVVVLTNSVPLNDAADWLAQAYIAALFDFPSPADYVSLASESRRKKVAAIERIRPAFDEIRRTHPDDQPRLPLVSYSGRYVNDAGNFFIDIGPHPEKPGKALLLRFLGRENQAYELRHVRGEVFEWSLACDESARQLRFPVIEAEYYEVRFESDGGRPKSLTWAGIGIRMLRNEGGGGEDGSKDQVRMGDAR
ncbi:penicillin-binding protein [Schizothecium vesticola]|uniref:Penicillin-binding protein n=1 Tax=Schizothecium vesticola TaxID=314040 RepID=A0AA40KBR3_9PEZI|nr:penicillin-binding protein [Schizothecium vesticola]